jgi:hypothetical protein
MQSHRARALFGLERSQWVPNDIRMLKGVNAQCFLGLRQLAAAFVQAACCQTARCVPVFDRARVTDRGSPCFGERLQRRVKACGRSGVARSQTGHNERPLIHSRLWIGKRQQAAAVQGENIEMIISLAWQIIAWTDVRL